MKLISGFCLLAICCVLTTGCQPTQLATDDDVDTVINQATAEAIAHASVELDSDAAPYVLSHGEYDSHPAWRRLDRLVLVHNEDSNVYRIPDGDEKRLVSIVIKGPKENPSVFFHSASNYHVELDPIDNDLQHLSVINLEANWFEAYVVTRESVRPFGANAYRDEIAELKGLQAFFSSLRENLPE